VCNVGKVFSSLSIKDPSSLSERATGSEHRLVNFGYEPKI
jgi:hypothetical protein